MELNKPNKIEKVTDRTGNKGITRTSWAKKIHELIQSPQL